MKRIAVIADLHCGHPTGLTPEPWQFKMGSSKERDALADYQNESWGRYVEMVDAIKPVDVLFVVGDCIDGRVTGRHLVSEDRDDQAKMAQECIGLWNAPEIVMVYGTRIHTGKLEKWERQIADAVGADIASRQFVKVDDVTFKLRHKVGRSRIPHGRFTAIARSAMWGELRAARDKDPQVDVHLFAHTHYHRYAGGPDWLAMTLPALQGSSEYGAEEIDDDVDWGVVWFDVEGKTYDWHSSVVKMQSSKPEVIRL